MVNFFFCYKEKWIKSSNVKAFHKHFFAQNKYFFIIMNYMNLQFIYKICQINLDLEGR